MDLGFDLLCSGHLSEVFGDSGNGEVAQGEREVVRDAQTVRINVTMGHSVVVEELKKKQALVVQICKLFLSEDLLRAVAFFIKLVVFADTSCRSIEHVDKRHLGEVDKSDVIKNRSRVLVHQENLLMHTREELLEAIGTVVFEELHQLSLVDDV